MKPNSNVIPLFVMVTLGGQFAFRLNAIYLRTRVRFSKLNIYNVNIELAEGSCTEQFSGKLAEPAIVGVEHFEPLPVSKSIAICENRKKYIIVALPKIDNAVLHTYVIYFIDNLPV